MNVYIEPKMKRLIFGVLAVIFPYCFVVGAEDIPNSLQTNYENDYFQNQDVSKDNSPQHTVAIGVRGGLNILKWRMGWREDPLVDDFEFESQVGWRSGISLDLKLYRHLFIETGLYYNVKTTRFNIGEVFSLDEQGVPDHYAYPYAIINPGFIEVPVMLSAQFQTSPQLWFHFGAGGYIAYGVSGKWKEYPNWNIDYNDEYESIRNLFRRTKKTWYDDDFPEGIEPEYPAMFRSFDIGLCFNSGVSFNKFHLDVCYDMGLRDMLNHEKRIGGLSFKTQSLSMNLGYDFYVK